MSKFKINHDRSLAQVTQLLRLRSSQSGVETPTRRQSSIEFRLPNSNEPNRSYRELIDGDHVAQIDSWTAHIKEVLGEALYKTSHWIYYGSAVTNSLGPCSDLDILILDNDVESPVRHSVYKGSNYATVYLISEHTLLDDLNRRASGGFFAGKLLLPFLVEVTRDQSVFMRDLYKGLGEFISWLASAKASTISRDKGQVEQSIVDTMLCYTELYPHYIYYLAKLFTLPNFDEILQAMVDEYALQLDAAERLRIVNDIPIVLYDSINVGDYLIESSETIALFWSIATYLHDNDYTFPLRYFAPAHRHFSQFDASENTEAFLDFLSDRYHYYGT